jgi:phosphatidate cytidylyltransferase
MIQGQGGMLDRLDSVGSAAPVFFHLTRYYFEPWPQRRSSSER